MASKNNNRAPQQQRSYSSVASQGVANKSAAPPAAAPAPQTVAPPPPAPSASALQAIEKALKEMARDEQVLQRSAFRHRLHSLAGKEVEVDLVDGSRAVGVLHTTTLYPGVRRRDVVLKAARVFGKGGELDNKVQPGSTLVLDFGNIVALSGQVTDASSLRQRGADFETDANIRKHGDLSHLHGRELVTVSTTWLDPETLTSLEGEAGGVSTGATTGGGVGGTGAVAGGSKDWDQFETNRRLFNVSTTFDENLYTKRIDHNSVTAEQLARAERLAREIETSATGNIHLLEERGHSLQVDYDEETLYSGVVRGATAPPAVPAATAARTVPSTKPVDGAWRKPVKLFPSTSSPSTTSSTPAATSPAITPVANKPPPAATAPAPPAAAATAPVTATTAPSAAKNTSSLSPPSGNNIGSGITAAPALAVPAVTHTSESPLPPPPAAASVVTPPAPSISTAQTPTETKDSAPVAAAKASQFKFNAAAREFVPGGGGSSTVPSRPVVAPLTVPAPVPSSSSASSAVRTPTQSTSTTPSTTGHGHAGASSVAAQPGSSPQHPSHPVAHHATPHQAVPGQLQQLQASPHLVGMQPAAPVPNIAVPGYPEAVSYYPAAVYDPAMAMTAHGGNMMQAYHAQPVYSYPYPMSYAQMPYPQMPFAPMTMGMTPMHTAYHPQQMAMPGAYPPQSAHQRQNKSHPSRDRVGDRRSGGARRDHRGHAHYGQPFDPAHPGNSGHSATVSEVVGGEGDGEDRDQVPQEGEMPALAPADQA